MNFCAIPHSPLILPPFSLFLFADGTHAAALETFESHLSELGWQSLCSPAGGRLPQLVPSARAAPESFGLLAAHRFEVSHHRHCSLSESL